MLKHVLFSLGIGFVTGIHIVYDGVSRVDHIGELLVNGNQVFVGDAGSLGVGYAVVSVVHAVGFLTQVVLRIGVVSAPTVDVEAEDCGLP